MRASEREKEKKILFLCYFRLCGSVVNLAIIFEKKKLNSAATFC